MYGPVKEGEFVETERYREDLIEENAIPFVKSLRLRC